MSTMTSQAQWTVQDIQEGQSDAANPAFAARKAGAHASAWAPMLLGTMVLLIALVGLVLLFLNRGVPRPDRWGFGGFQ